MSRNKEHPVVKAIRLSGGPLAVAKALGIKSPWSVYKWRNNKRVPSERVIPLEKLCDCMVTRHELRPDLYPYSDDAA